MNQKLEAGKMRSFQEFPKLSWCGCNMSAQLQYVACQLSCNMSAQLQYVSSAAICQLSCNMSAQLNCNMSAQLSCTVSAQVRAICQLSSARTEFRHTNPKKLKVFWIGCQNFRRQYVSSTAICQLSSIAMCSPAQLQCVGSGAVCQLNCNMSAT